MKKNTIIFVVLYNDEILAVCRSRSVARNLCKKHILEIGYFVDKFDIKEYPLV